MNIDDLNKAVAAGEIDTVLVCMVDMQGRLIGKRFHAEFFIESGGGTHACDYLLANDITMEPVPGFAAASWQKGYGDFELRPDFSTLRRLPWLPGTALVLCDVLDHQGAEVVHSPRAMLRVQLARLAEIGLTAKCASELEFYLFAESHAQIHSDGYRSPKLAGHYIEDYHILQTTREEGFMRVVRNSLHSAGIAVENSKGEWGPGQAEINVCYDDALVMADKHALMKNAIKEIAAQQDKAVTFMAKWRDDLAGSSSHIHMSLWGLEDGAPRSFATGEPDGMSPLMRHFVAGMIAHAQHITYLLAPNINSYKRFVPGTFAPTTSAWSFDNRTAGFRLVGHDSKALRIECRIGGADLNPYLAYAGLIAAGIDGIARKLVLAPPIAGDSYELEDLPRIPTTLRDAVDAFADSQMLSAAFGERVIAHYVHAGRWEQKCYDTQVTDWELRRGLEQA